MSEQQPPRRRRSSVDAEYDRRVKEHMDEAMRRGQSRPDVIGAPGPDSFEEWIRKHS
jgi:hypothetical protein